jgi:hypothetical protein
MLKNFKARELRKPVIEHLLNIGYKSNHSVEALCNSPYIIAHNNYLLSINLVSPYRESNFHELNESSLLKLQPEINIIKTDKVFEIGSKLIKYLNTKKISLSDDYEVIFAIQKPNNEMLCNKWEILPISPNACGSISMEKMKLIMGWLDKNSPSIDYSFSYTDYNENKVKYGTSRPCICLY